MPASFFQSRRAFPFCIKEPPGGELPAANRPFGLTMAQLAEVYWRVAKFDLRVSGTFSASTTPDDFPLDPGSDDPPLAQTLSSALVASYVRGEGNPRAFICEPPPVTGIVPGPPALEWTYSGFRLRSTDPIDGEVAGDMRGWIYVQGAVDFWAYDPSGSDDRAVVFRHAGKYWPYFSFYARAQIEADAEQATKVVPPVGDWYWGSEGSAYRMRDIWAAPGLPAEGSDFTGAIPAILKLAAGNVTGQISTYGFISETITGEGAAATVAGTITEVTLKATEWFSYGDRWDTATGARNPS